jgi:hypothetical protein
VYVAGRTDKEGDELFVIEESSSVSSAKKAVASVGRSEQSDEDIVSNYPSPFTDGFTLRVSGSENAAFKMEMLTLNGQVIDEAELAYNKQHQIPTSSLTNGMYILKIRTEKGNIIRKVVKQSR